MGPIVLCTLTAHKILLYGHAEEFYEFVIFVTPIAVILAVHTPT